jgi:hypothetical protein
MASIEVDGEGLSRLAHYRETQVVRLGVTGTPLWTDGFQPTSAAVNAANAVIVGVAALLTARLRTTAVTVSSASADYASTETAAAREIAALDGGTAV